MQEPQPGVTMPARSDTLADRLYRYREIKITVIGRKSGRAISITVWFVLDEDKLYLLPVQGSDTQWYKNVLKNSSIRIGAGSVEAELKVVLSLMHQGWQPWSKNSVTSTGRATSGNTTQSSTLLLSLRCGDGVFSNPVHPPLG